ncbi:MAG: winged helix-turn-helix transcriptional regulator [Bacteroidales bacterium]|nr:winged helix-turn-helix transcriptional regulator [Bacteroidales bacterium]
MIAVIKGDIIASRKLVDQEKWLLPLKELLNTWGKSPQNWELVWGDFFQIEFQQPEESLRKIFEIKALIKKIEPLDNRKLKGTIEVRIAAGIGNKSYVGQRISESNGSAFIYAGEKFDLLKKENVTMGVKSHCPNFDNEINLYLKLAGTFIDKWSVSSAQLIEIVLKNPTITQQEIGNRLGIKQSAVSGRWSRANVDELLAVEKMYRNKIKALLK